MATRSVCHMKFDYRKKAMIHEGLIHEEGN